MRKIDRRIIIIAALIFIIGLSYGLMKYLISLRDDPKSNAIPEAIRYVKVDTVEYNSILSPVEAPGRLRSRSQTDIIAEASGKIIAGKIALKKGSSFQKGDLLFSIYPDEVKLALLSRKSQFKSSLANLLPDLGFDFPEQEDQLREYFLSLDIQKDFPPFPDIKDEKLNIFLAGRNIISEYYSIKKDELQLKRHNKYAPYNGTFQEVYLEAGAYANTGGKVALAIQTDLLEAEVPLERFHSEWVKTGDKVKITTDRNGIEFTGKVVRKSGFVDENTQSQSVFVQIANHGNRQLLSGEYVHVHFPGQAIENAMEIPRNAVFNTNQVFVIRNGRLRKQDINILKVNTTSLIMNGLTENDIVVIQPLVNVLEGTKVAILGDTSGNVKTTNKGNTKLSQESAQNNSSR